MDNRIRVNIGCGKTPTQGWRNFDNSLSLRLSKIPLLPELLHRTSMVAGAQYEYMQFVREHSIECGDATKRLPFAAGSVDALYSSHMLEHLDRAEVTLFLREARRILRSGGTIRLVVPDLRYQVDQYVTSGNADAMIDGSGLTKARPRGIAQRLRMLLVGTRHHQWMYDGASLAQLLVTAGFQDAVVMPPGETRIQDPGALDLRERQPGSVCVEAINP